jgi:hypothetical protein
MKLLMKVPGIRKILLSALVFFTCSSLVFSQGCNVQWVDSGFIYPFSDSFPCMEQGVGFNSSFQVNMPNMFHGILLLDSIFIDSITGLPPGITWSSSPFPLTLYADSSGCITLSGTTNADTGTYDLNFFCHAVVTSQSSAGTQELSYNQLLAIGDAPIPVYSVDVIFLDSPCHPYDTIALTAISELSNSTLVNVYPNPIKTGKWLVTVSDDAIGNQADVYDTYGRILFSTIIRRRSFAISPDNFAAGIYLLRIHSSNFSVVNKLLKL